MHIDQEARDKLREKQYELQPTVIGAIVEHRVQDPFMYKKNNRNRPTSAEVIKALEEKPKDNVMAHNKRMPTSRPQAAENGTKREWKKTSTNWTNATNGENSSQNSAQPNGDEAHMTAGQSRPIDPIVEAIANTGEKADLEEAANLSKIQLTSDKDIDKPADGNKILNTEDLPIKKEDVEKNNWVHMDQVEFDKVAWMMKEDRSKIESLNGPSQQARFDMEGKLVVQEKDGVKIKEIPSHLGLHHHGDEPDMAGYTIEELLCYLRSSYERQRVLAMNILGNICTWAHNSFYDNIFDTNIASMIINEAILSVRMNLDSPNDSTALSALRCLHAFICNTNVDELVLDKAFPLLIESPSKNMWLEPKCWQPGEDEDESRLPMLFFSDDLQDGDCVKRDPIAALVERTELITRLRYLLDIKPSRAYDKDNTIHDCIFDILIRIARHSPKMCAYLSGYPHLLQAIEDSYLPLVVTTEVLDLKKPSVKALKFIRILASADLEYQRCGRQKEAVKLDTLDTASHALTWQISSTVQQLLSYLFIEPMTDDAATNAHCLRVSIEALRCWTVFLQLKTTKNEMTNYFTGVTTLIKNHLNALKKLEAITRGETVKQNEYDWQFAAALISVLSQFTQNLPMAGRMFLSDISYMVFNWTRHIIEMNMIPSISVSLALTSGIDYLVKNEFETEALQHVFLKSITDGASSSGLSSRCLIKLITRGCLHRSPLQLSEEYSGCLRDSPNLPSFGCILFNRTTTQSIKMTPFLEEESPFLLFRSIIESLNVIKCPPAILKNLFKDTAFHEYLIQIRKLDGCAISFEGEIKSRLFEQCELLTLSKALLCICEHYVTEDSTVEKKLSDSPSHVAKRRISYTNRLQCYDNLFSMSMSCISLLTSKSVEAVGLRQKLLTDVILNPEFNKRLVEEMDPSLKQSDKMNFHLDCSYAPQLSFDALGIIYQGCKFSDRLWAFEPLFNYYQASQDDLSLKKEQATKDKEAKNRLTIIDEDQEMNVDFANDESKIIMVLNLINMICKRSKLYTHLVLKPNLEDCLCLLGTVFLTDGLFLDQGVSRSLRDVILSLLRECIDPHDDANIPFQDPARIIKGINISVYDFFIKLVEQYEGASYGDPTFSNYLLIFMTHKSHSSHKKYLLSEKFSTCFYQFRIDLEDLWIPDRMLFSNKEQDKEILELYKRLSPSIKRRSLAWLNMLVSFHLTEKC